MEKYNGIASRVESDTFFIYIASHDQFKEIIFDKYEYSAKLCAGPTLSRPGPMLFIVAATAVKFVV